jgi:hypothetical protein
MISPDIMPPGPYVLPGMPPPPAVLQEKPASPDVPVPDTTKPYSWISLGPPIFFLLIGGTILSLYLLHTPYSVPAAAQDAAIAMISAPAPHVNQVSTTVAPAEMSEWWETREPARKPIPPKPTRSWEKPTAVQSYYRPGRASSQVNNGEHNETLNLNKLQLQYHNWRLKPASPQGKSDG